MHSDVKIEAENIISKFLTEMPFVENKPCMQTEEAKQCAIISVNWMKDCFCGELHQTYCDRLIKAIKEY